MTRRTILLALLAASRAAAGQTASRRFPQPVRVGDLLGRDVLQPEESQPVLGRVEAIVRKGEEVAVVMSFGGVLGFATRPIAVPVDAMAVLGQFMAVIDVSPEALKSFPTFDPAGWTRLGDGETIKVGLVRPFH